VVLEPGLRDREWKRGSYEIAKLRRKRVKRVGRT
jgi:hypothetical protein